MTEKEIKEFANKIAELHYANKPNSIKDTGYRQARMKALKQQIINALSERQESTEISEQSNGKALHIADVIKSVCTHHITDCQHVKLHKECTFKGRCNHKQTVL